MRLAALLLVGCASGGTASPPGHFDVYVDAGAEVTQDITAGASAWNAATGSDITIVRLPCAGCWTVRAMTSADLDTWAAQLNGQPENYWGLTVPESKTIAIDSALTGDALRVTSIHELGHMLGLLHPCPLGVACDAVMGPQYGFSAESVTANDVEQYDRLTE